MRLRPGDPSAASLALVAAVALEEVVARLVPRGTMLKWPNDLLVSGAKLSGILLERVGDNVVIGIGVNVAHHPDLADRRATSIAEQGAAITPAALLDRLAEMLAAWIGIWRGQGLSPIVARWIERAHPVGTPLTARLADGTALDGNFETMAQDGALVLRLADGSTRVIHAGDVFLV